MSSANKIETGKSGCVGAGAETTEDARMTIRLDADKQVPRVFDVMCEQTGAWLGWVGPSKDPRSPLALKSTGAPLTDEERFGLAAAAAAILGEYVHH